MAAASTISGPQTVALSNPPALGTNDLRGFVDEIFGVPYQQPAYSLEGFSEQTKFVQSLPELLFGVNKTNLGTRVITQQLLADNFYVQVLAPIVPLQWGESLETQWDEMIFDPHLPQVVPEEGKLSSQLSLDKC